MKSESSHTVVYTVVNLRLAYRNVTFLMSVISLQLGMETDYKLSHRDISLRRVSR
jgi:hypothetical protein